MKKYILPIGVIAGLILLYYGFTTIRDYVKDKHDYSSLSNSNTKADKSKDSTVVRKKTDFQIATDAELLDEALLRNSGEDEETVSRILFSYQSLNDFVELTKVFGVREDESLTKSFRGTLPQALTAYLSEKELKPIVKHLSYYNISI